MNTFVTHLESAIDGTRYDADRVQTMQATLHMLRNITRRGRKRWLAMAFVSQQPGHLPPEIFELCNTRIVHALRSTHNLDALMATTGDVSRDLWARCPLLGPGQAVVTSPQLNRSVIVSVRPAGSFSWRTSCAAGRP